MTLCEILKEMSKETGVADIWDAIFLERFQKNVEKRGGKKRHESRKKRYREGLGMITGYLPWLQHFRGRKYTQASKNGKKRLAAKRMPPGFARLRRPSRTPRISRPLLPSPTLISDPFKLALVFTQIKNGGCGAVMDFCILSATESLILNFQWLWENTKEGENKPRIVISLVRVQGLKLLSTEREILRVLRRTSREVNFISCVYKQFFVFSTSTKALCCWSDLPWMFTRKADI